MEYGDTQWSVVEKLILHYVSEYRMSLPEASNEVRKNWAHPDQVDAVATELLNQASRNQAFSGSVVNPNTYGELSAPWYVPEMAGANWSSYRDLLVGRGAPGLETLDEETTRITGLLANPNARGQKRKGLVMGNVQSGKTRNFAGVVAKAADAGYKFIIVLAGMHNNLREQTQTRLNQDLFDLPEWYPFTDETRDLDTILKPSTLFRHEKFICAVVKKNTTRLGNLITLLRDVPQPVRLNSPILIVDDEADQATPNSLAEKNQVSAINQRLRDVWDLVETGTYLAYTATPFANILINPDETGDLFPSDFITTIEPGEGYFGPERVFGISDTAAEDSKLEFDGLDMVREIPAPDSAVLKPPSNAEDREIFDPVLPGSLRKAVAWFVVASAIRRARGQDSDSSMLVHTTHYTAPHFAMQRRLQQMIGDWKSAVAAGNTSVFQTAWTDEATRIPEEATKPLPNWTVVRHQLTPVLNDLEVIVDNGSSEDRLNYHGDPRTVIAVGGGTLSRGLTLEGLVTSYFTRTTNAYDTLLQMGRWFGYRTGYEDLPRVWVAEKLDEDYAFLARVEKELREEIESLQGSEYSPHQVGVRLRQHPGRLQVTANNKMFAALTVQFGLSGTSNQTFLLNGADPAITNRNIAAVERLIAGALIQPVPWAAHRWWRPGVSTEQVSEFMTSFVVHEDQAWLSLPENLQGIRRWLKEYANGVNWNVVLAAGSNEVAKDGRSELGTLMIAGEPIQCLDRSPLNGSTPSRLDFKAVMSANDRLADIDPKNYDTESATNHAEMRRIRRLRAADTGLIVIYPISGNSKAATPANGTSQARMDIPVDHHILGFAIFYPNVQDQAGEGTFISVRRTWEVPDSVEGDDDFEEEVTQ